MKLITGKKNELAKEIARMGLPPLRVDDGLIELSIQEYSASSRWVTRNYPADCVPAVGDQIELADENVTNRFMVVEIKHVLAPHAKETVRAALLVVERIFHA
jgi:hypothetical protein